MDQKHASRPAIVNRLKRAEGHLRAIIEMIQAERPCVDIAQQLHAVEGAITKAKRELIHDHLDHCLESHDAGADLADLRRLAKYL
jgi:DNA-binding FrmR family transcriptional regulator